jgi:hypothetical protein
MEVSIYFFATNLLLQVTIAWHLGMGTCLVTTLCVLFGICGSIVCDTFEKEKEARKQPLTRASIHDRLTQSQWKLLEERIRKVTPSGIISLSGNDGYFMNLTEDNKTRLKECGYVICTDRKAASFKDVKQSDEAEQS